MNSNMASNIRNEDEALAVATHVKNVELRIMRAIRKSPLHDPYSGTLAEIEYARKQKSRIARIALDLSDLIDWYDQVIEDAMAQDARQMEAEDFRLTSIWSESGYDEDGDY